MKQKRHFNIYRLIMIFFLSVLISVITIHPFMIKGEETKTVRVGFHEEPYFITDDMGRWSGYTYEYQHKIAAYTGWKFEYVHGTFTELLQMLEDGQIDMMGNISYTEERADKLLFSSVPMGTESYYLFVGPGNTHIKEEDFSSINDRRIGVTKNSFQQTIFQSWIDSHNVSPKIVELTNTEEESLKLVGDRIEGFVTVDVYGTPEVSTPVWKIGSSDYYFAVNKDRQDLLIELNEAMGIIHDENPYFNTELHEKYLRNNQTIYYLTEKERDWLLDHPTIKVGYQDNYLAFCEQDKQTGELIGALKDYLDYVSTGFENADLNFEAICYPSSGAAIEALKNGEVDCMFPANLSEYESEVLGIVTTPSFMTTEMDAVVRASDQKEFIRQEDIIVAVNEGNTNYEVFLKDNYPSWSIKYFVDTPTGLEAIARGEADCVIISNYRFSNIAKQCEKLHLTTVYTGVDLDYSLAVKQGNPMLYSILSKASRLVPDSVIHSSLTYYSTEDAKTTFLDTIKENIVPFLITIIIIVSIIVALLIRDIVAERKIIEEERLLHSLNEKVFYDSLTSVRNKGAFSEYLDQLQDRVDNKEEYEFAIGVFDCDDLKMINDIYGHDKGDVYLKNTSKLICEVFKHSPVFRIGGDEFAVVLENDDYRFRAGLIKQFEMAKNGKELNKNRWEQVHVSSGIAEFDPEIDISVHDTARRADKIMYENKRLNKQGR